MAIIYNEDRTSYAETQHGLQLRQYQSQLRKAGLLDAIYRARGIKRLELERAASALIRDLRKGRVMPDTKEHAAKLGLRIYPN